ncbi:N-acetylglutaminylglutamine synthetase [Fodinicurvata sediminis]|uniref:N-acetylglutaminylglutamine synthetase n=1 Tax=Fodinicurvata sediminis TaxID=1121832 RepID=UPI00068423EC|nr:N-acetylglutaminylglutamine synthetase [Fodinicurvata sediminis]
MQTRGPGAETQNQAETPQDVVLDCGWGRLLFAQTFEDGEVLLDRLLEEQEGCRDIAFYVGDPHVLLSLRPQQVFLDPSNTYRLELRDLPETPTHPAFTVAPLDSRQDAQGVNTCYAHHGMVAIDEDFLLACRDDPRYIHLVARDQASGEVLGTVTGLDHVEIFGDPDNGSSLWCLAVTAQAPYPGIGVALVIELARRLAQRGLSYMDLSVLYDNEEAIALYEKLGFRPIQRFALKTRNSINEKLYIGPAPEQDLNPYARLIVDEARRRGIAVEVLDAEGGFFRLTHGGRSIVCRESLSEMTTAIAMSRCDDKAVTQRLLRRAGLSVPEQARAGTAEENARFLEKHGRVVVKPLRGEQGHGVAVDLRTAEAVEAAVTEARQHCDIVLLEKYVEGDDLRVIVINYEVVAAAVRRPAEIIGSGKHTIRQLIETQSRRRAKATDGESTIPLDGETERCVEEAGYSLTEILPAGQTLRVRKAANLHTGGTIHDVTESLHPHLSAAAVEAARAIEIPVVGLDFLVPSPEESDYVIIEANERPGLANHEPAPTAQKFIDLLFPHLAA